MSRKSGCKPKRPVYQKNQVDDLFMTAYELHNRGENAKAENLYKNIIRLDPYHSNALNLLGTIAMEKGEYDTALSLIQRAVNAYPNGAIFHNNLSTVYRSIGRIADAEKACRNALRVDPDYVEAHNNLGTILQDKGDMDGAIDSYVTAYRKNSGFSPAYYNLGRIFCEQGYITASIWSYRQALDINPGFHEAWSNLLYTLHFSEKASPQEIFDEHRKWAHQIARPLYPNDEDFINSREPFRTLNIGYVSSDFRTHSVAFFLEDILASHDKEMYKIFCYSNVMKGDGYTHRFKELASEWRDISRLTDQEAARQIKKDRIDILVDLSGHTGNSRIRVFAMKPSPIQVTWLGYPDTTGLDVMDFRLTDSIADPPGDCDHYYTESLYRMPDGFLCYRPSGESSPVAPSPFSKTGRITFGSFNNNSKISESTVAVWAKILRRVPWSRLKLKSRSFDDFGTRKHILELFENHGVISERIWFEGYSVGLREHFLLYNTVDIALDTFPYNGTTTTCEALWMGVPVIVLSGNSHVSRVGASILSHLGLDDYISNSGDDYVSKAAALANDPERLWKLRFELRNRMMNSSLMNPSMFTATLERAFRDMWRTWIRKRNEAEMNKTEAGGAVKQFYELNLAVLKKHHQEIVLKKGEPTVSGMEIRNSDTGIPNLYVKSDTGSWNPVYIEDNPLADLEGLLEQLKTIKGKVILIFGGGLLIHAGHVLKAVGDVNLVVFFEALPEVFDLALKTSDLTEVLSHPNCRFAVGDQADPYLILESIEDKVFLNNGCECVANKNVVLLAPAWYEEKRKLFEAYLTRKQVSLVAASFAGQQFLSNNMSNLQAIAESEPLNALEGKFKGLPAIIVATGPSLSLNVHEMREYQDKAVIIASDSSVPTLNKHGIQPHFVATVDYNDYNYEKLASFCHDLKNTSLVFLSTATSKVLNYIKVKHRYSFLPDKSAKDLFDELLPGKFTSFEEIQSVIHLGLLTAQIAGCSPIIFVGLDLAFKGVKDHADEAILHWGNTHLNNRNMIMAEGSVEKTVTTTRDFLSMLEVTEQMMRQYPDRIYIDATEGGVRKKGSEIMSLNNACEKFCNNHIQTLLYSDIEVNEVNHPLVIDKLVDLKNRVMSILSTISEYERALRKVREFFRNKRLEHIQVRNFPEKVKQSLKKMDSINLSLDHDKTLSILKGLLSQHYSEYLSYEIKIKGDASNEGSGLRLAVNMDQQEFVQKIRKEALQSFLNLIDGQLRYYESLMGFISDSKDNTIQLSDFYMKNDHIVSAESLLLTTPDTPLREYSLGCIELKRGLIKEGKRMVSHALSNDGSLKWQADLFYMDIIAEWLKDKMLKSYQNICLSRAVYLAPENSMVLHAWDEMNYHRIRSLVDKKLFGMAAKELAEIEEIHPINHIHLNIMYAFILLESDQAEKGVEQLLRAVQEVKRNPELGICMSYYWSRICMNTQFTPEKEWVKKLVELAGSDERARMVIQELWWFSIDKIEAEVIWNQISSSKIKEFETILFQWSDLEHILPEWSYFKSLCELSKKHFSDSIQFLDKAIKLSSEVIHYPLGKYHFQMMKGVVYIWAGDVQNGIDIIVNSNAEPDKLTIALRILYGYLSVRSGLAEQVLMINDSLLATDISHDGVLKEWVQHIFQQNGFHSLNSLNIISSWYVLTGQYWLKTGNIENGSRWLRGAINIDPQAIQVIESLSLKSYVIDQWISDTSKIEMNLHDGKISEAEQLIDGWEYTRSILPDYTILKSRIIEKKENLEKAVDYLVSRIDEERENPEYLSYCARIFLANGLVDDAGYLIERAVQINKRYAFLWDEAGDVARELHHHTAALACYEKCLVAVPGRMDVLRKIGDIYQIQGNTESSVMAYEMVLKHKPDDSLARESLESIRNRSKS